MAMTNIVTLQELMKKNPEMKLSDIESLRDWCEKQQHLPKVEDIFLAMFLHSNYYRIEAAKNTIENYYTTRTHVPEFFCSRDPLGGKNLRQAFKVVANIPLKGKTKENYTIIYGSFLDTDPSHYVYRDVIKCILMINDVWLLSNGTSDGIVFIADTNGLSLGHVTRMNLMDMKKYLFYIQEAAPIRLKTIHFLNAPPAMEVLMNMMKPFLKKEIIDMIHFHSSTKSAAEYVPIEALPNEAGGQAGPMHELAETELRKVENYREWFLMDEATRRVKEELRIGKSKSASDLFGVEGSFKKLDID